MDTARDEAVAAKERLRDALGDAQREAQRAEHAEEQRRLAEALAAQSQADATAAQHARLAAESHLEEAMQSNKEVSLSDFQKFGFLASSLTSANGCATHLDVRSEQDGRLNEVRVCSCLQRCSTWSRTGLPRRPACLPSCRRRMQLLSVLQLPLLRRMPVHTLTWRRESTETNARSSPVLRPSATQSLPC